MPLPLPAARCALTAPFHPYPVLLPCGGEGEAVCFLWRFPWGYPRRTLSGAVSPWSPDFPPRASTAAVQPTGDPSDMGIVPERQQRAREGFAEKLRSRRKSCRGASAIDKRAQSLTLRLSEGCRENCG